MKTNSQIISPQEGRSKRLPPLFLGWHRPWLPRLAEYLLAQGGTLSQTSVILPGRRAGRRLLELLALQAQAQSILLEPPTIMTLEEAMIALLEIPETPPIAGKSITLLGWRQAALQLTLEELRAIQRVPEGVNTSEICLSVATLAERLASELGRAGLSIEEVLLQHTPFFPESADREEPRWRALAHLQKEYQKILLQWGYIDRSAIVRKKLQQGRCRENQRILVAGVVDMPPLFVPFFEKVNPEIVIIAPQEHASGFDIYGRVISSYWLEHPAEVADELLIPCERSRDQALQAWEIIMLWRESDTSITIVAPEPEALPFLRETGVAAGVKTRSAGGRSFQGGSLSALLTALRNFLDRTPNESPSLAAVADLLRQPLVATKLTGSLSISSEILLRELDYWEREHLPFFLDKKELDRFHKGETLGALLRVLEKNFTFGLKPEPLPKLLRQWRELLLHLLDKERIQRNDPTEHFFLECFEKLMLCVEELEQLSVSAHLIEPSFRVVEDDQKQGSEGPQPFSTSGATPRRFLWRSTELLSLFLDILNRETVPELEQPHALEMIGWLEAAAEDTHLLVLTSFHEGAIPGASKTDPLLSETLRKRLGFRSSEEQLGRDHYYLQSILASRKKEGGVAILAPRYNGRGEPVRPSRLLLQGCSEHNLPSRILKLTQRQKSPLLSSTQQSHCSLFYSRPIDLLPIERLNVTSLRTYLRSPRLFYLQHVLKLQEILETPVEMTPRQFGVLIHQILGTFSAERSLQKESNEAIFLSWLEQALERTFQWQFGWNSVVFSQKGELLRTLKGFAQAEAAHRQEGWTTVFAEGERGHSSLVEEKMILHDGRSLLLQGRIDRLDWHPEKRRWLLLDYKTSHRQEWKKETPNRTHFQRQGETILWHDLQLPLYLKLAPQLKAIRDSELPLPTIENTDLCHFQLPIHPEAAGISEPFATTMIEPAWRETERLIELILAGHFEEIGTLDANVSPTFTALCGTIPSKR